MIDRSMSRDEMRALLLKEAQTDVKVLAGREPTQYEVESRFQELLREENLSQGGI